jgi:hypothetical protein
MRNRYSANTEAIRQNAERRQRENEASRLLIETPGLLDLHIDFEESGLPEGIPPVQYVRRFVLATTPSVFLIPCSNPMCNGGGYDLTHEMMAGLRSRQPRIAGEHACGGTVGEAQCALKLRFAATAVFDAGCPVSAG